MQMYSVKNIEVNYMCNLHILLGWRGARRLYQRETN